MADALPDTTARAHGRVNLMGDHTDYNEGLVLPCCIPQHTTVNLRVSVGDAVTVSSAASGGQRVSYLRGAEQRRGDWSDYVQGTTWALTRAGHRTDGFDAVIESNVPMGSGLASSAALQVAMLRALRAAFGLALSDLDVARLAHVAETQFVGVPVGMMDQLAASLGRDGTALSIDTRSLDVEAVELPEGLELVVIDSGVSHAHGSGDYRKRRAECTDAAGRLGVRSLRELSAGDLSQLNILPAVLACRVRHVVTENERVVRTVKALRDADLPELKRLFYLSHASLRDDYQVSVPEVDAIVAFAAKHPDMVGARLTGGGFGGAVVMLAHKGKGLLAATDIERRCRERGAQKTQVLLPER